MCFRGFLLGVLLTIGGAYVYDSMQTATEVESPGIERTLVNWEVVGRNLQALAVRVHKEWDRLIG